MHTLNLQPLSTNSLAIVITGPSSLCQNRFGFCVFAAKSHSWWLPKFACDGCHHGGCTTGIAAVMMGRKAATSGSTRMENKG